MHKAFTRFDIFLFSRCGSVSVADSGSFTYNTLRKIALVRRIAYEWQDRLSWKLASRHCPKLLISRKYISLANAGTLAKLFSIKSTELGALVCVTKNLIDLQGRLIKEEKQKCSFLWAQSINRKNSEREAGAMSYLRLYRNSWIPYRVRTNLNFEG
jgi:hypothetical protein